MTLIYEDDLIKMSLAKEPVAKGHILLEPVSSHDAISSLDDSLLEHLFFGASYAATALFELAGAQGTNIILEEHPLRVNIIARTQDDGLDFLWQPTKGDPSQLQSVAKSIKDKIDILEWKKNNPDTSSQDEVKEVIVDEKQEGVDGEEKTNFLLKSLQRVP
jgi:histidine triad (HIT) family protein